MNEPAFGSLVVCVGLRFNSDCVSAMHYILGMREHQDCRFLMKDWVGEECIRKASLLWMIDHALSMEAVAALHYGIPLLVPDENSCLRELCFRANCGLVYRDSMEAAVCLQLLLGNRVLRDRMAESAMAHLALSRV